MNDLIAVKYIPGIPRPCL